MRGGCAARSVPSYAPKQSNSAASAWLLPCSGTRHEHTILHHWGCRKGTMSSNSKAYASSALDMMPLAQCQGAGHGHALASALGACQTCRAHGREGHAGQSAPMRVLSVMSST